jgi:hypothetical protein
MGRMVRTSIGSLAVAFAVVAYAPAVMAETPAASAPASSGDTETLRERAARFWAARVASDYNTQWELLEPRGRGKITASEYAGQRGRFKYLAYQVEDASVNGYFGKVNVKVLVQPMLTPGKTGIGPQTVTVPDEWVRIDGTWYRSLEQQGDPGLQTVPR